MTEETGTILTNEPAAKTETPPASWYPEEYKGIVEQQGWKSPGDAVRDYSELHKSASGKIKIPTPESSAEEISNFYAKIRGVDSPDGYEVKVPENVPLEQDMINKLRQWAFEAGAPKTAFETVLKNYLDELSNQAMVSLEVARKELQDEWKDDYKVNYDLADRFFNNNTSEEFRAAVLEMGLNNHPVFIREFLNLAKKTATDKFVKGDTAPEPEGEYTPRYPNSPEMYANDESPEGAKARAWHEARGHKY